MENPFIRHKKREKYGTIFSKLEEDTQKIQKYEQLDDNLAKLQQNLLLLDFFGSKTKINTKKIKKKFFSLPKITQTEPNQRSMISNKNLHKKEFDFLAHKKKKKNIKEIIHEDTKTNYNNNSPRTNLFLTKIDHKGESKTSKKNITMSTKYITGDKTFVKTKDNLIPEQKKVYDPTFLTMNNSFIKTKNKIINNNKKNKSVKTMRINNTFCTKEQFPKMTNIMIKDLKKENNDIKKAIHKGMEKFNIMEWYMKTRFKYAQYKYGIAEIQKYFMDIKAYGKPEEEEIEKRKTFLEHVEDIIDDIHEIQQQKSIEKLNKKYGIEHDKKKIKSKNEQNENENPQQKQIFELSRALQEIAKRKKDEKKKRNQIDDILFKCDQGIHSINVLDKKLSKKG
jgi:hypothetical protein